MERSIDERAAFTYKHPVVLKGKRPRAEWNADLVGAGIAGIMLLAMFGIAMLAERNHSWFWIMFSLAVVASVGLYWRVVYGSGINLRLRRKAMAPY